MELKNIKRALEFSNLLENNILENLRDLFEFSKEFTMIYDEEIAKLPYHINLIDELHANENAYSRIFAKLLRYEEKSKYPFLEKFLNEVCKFNVCVEKPNVGKVDSNGRIDIPIFDKKYVVIIENKITDQAPDQNNSNGGQLARYIESINKTDKRKFEEIYVVYTPKYTREPSEKAWINNNEYSYKIDFKDRFCSLSYRNDIYPWLKNDVLSNIDKSKIYLNSAVEQYVDHLEGMFSLRIINKQMNMKLQEFIKKEFGIPENNPEAAIEILSEKETELDNAKAQIQQLKSSYQRQIIENRFKEWEKKLIEWIKIYKKDFPDLKIVGENFVEDENKINIGIKHSIENEDFVAIIECNNYEESQFCFGISSKFTSSEENLKFKSKTLQTIIDDNEWEKQNDDGFYCWKYTSLENAYTDLESLIKSIIELIKNPNS